MKIATLDLGSNTFLLLVAEINNGKVVKVYEDLVTITRLGQGVNQSGEFHPEALERVEECFKHYSAVIQKHKVDKVIAMATSAARDAKNKEDFFSLGRKYNIPIEIIPGEKEAEITYLGSTFDIAGDGVAVIDVGGGSTEVIVKNSEGTLLGKSLDIGSVRLTEKFISKHPVSMKELQNLKSYVIESLESNKAFLPNQVNKVVAVAGTPTMLSCLVQEIEFQEELVHKSELSVSVMEEWLERLANLSVKERTSFKGMVAKRADVIIAGLVILIEVTKYLGVDQLIVSTKGVRFGVALFSESL